MMEGNRTIFPQSAAVPFRMQNGRMQILLITSRSGKHWIVPKGIIEEWQSPEEAAMEEAFEEAGVKGTLMGDSIGKYEYRKWGGICRVGVFLMRVDEIYDEWPEAGLRERKWGGADKALDLIDNPDLREVVRLAADSMR